MIPHNLSLATAPVYHVQPVTACPSWDSEVWQAIPAATLRHFHPQSTDHRPLVEARVVYEPSQLHVLFDVQDCCVVARHTAHQQNVYEDSCVEFFVQPKQTHGYFNFEVNCAGWMLLYYIEDPAQMGDAPRRYRIVPPEQLERVGIFPSLPARVEREIAGPLRWRLGLSIPFALLEDYVGSLGDVRGQTWTANFYKCADHCSKPHWAAWSPIGEELNFHQPQYFGKLHYANK